MSFVNVCITPTTSRPDSSDKEAHRSSVVVFLYSYFLKYCATPRQKVCSSRYCANIPIASFGIRNIIKISQHITGPFHGHFNGMTAAHTICLESLWVAFSNADFLRFQMSAGILFHPRCKALIQPQSIPKVYSENVSKPLMRQFMMYNTSSE